LGNLFKDIKKEEKTLKVKNQSRPKWWAQSASAQLAMEEEEEEE